MGGGGLYVLGGANLCPQAAGPLFTGLGAADGGGRPGRLAAGPVLASGDGEERVGEHRQRDVPVPGVPLADLVVVQPGLVLGLGEAVLDRPPGAGHGDQLCQGGAGRGVAPEERQLQLTFLARYQGPADQELVLTAGGCDQRPVIQPRALGAVPARQHLPSAAGNPCASSSARSLPAAVATCSLQGTAITYRICCSSSQSRRPG